MAEFRRCSNNIEVKNFLPEDTSPAMKPVTKFEEAFHQFPGILSTIRKQACQFVLFFESFLTFISCQGFKVPSPIQSQAWPYLLSGKDLIGIAQTGTGKTLGKSFMQK